MRPISDINTYWSKALQRLAFIFMGLKFLIQTVKLPDENSWAYPILRNLGECVIIGDTHCPTEKKKTGGSLHFIRNLDNKKAVFAVAELRRQFEFSAERLSDNAKTIKITLFTELLTVISP